MQDDKYNFNINTTIGDIPFWQYYDNLKITEMSAMQYDCRRFLAWLFPRQYGGKQIG